MGITTSTFPLLSSLGPEVTGLPFVLCFFLNKRFLNAAGILLFWHFVIRFGLGLRDPLIDCSDDEEKRIYFVIYPFLVLGYALLASIHGFFYLVPDLFPIVYTLKYYIIKNIDNKPQSTSSKVLSKRIDRHCMEKMPPSGTYMAYIFIFILFLTLGIYAPYTLLVDAHDVIMTCLLILETAVFWPIGCLILYFFIHDKNIWGIDFMPSGSPTKEANEVKNIIRKKYAVAFVPPWLMHTAFSVIIGLVRFFKPDVDWIWITGLTVLLIALLVTLVIYFFARKQINAIMMAPKQTIEEEGENLSSMNPNKLSSQYIQTKKMDSFIHT